MKELNFRNLKAEEIDCRIATISAKCITLLLYKDARCDMNILDETVGAYNWQRSHSRDNANCTVSIWDDEKEMWICKEDVGTESNTEAVKGLASDSFKRACFNWGIGRELYTSPRIFIDPAMCNMDEKNGKPITYDTFSVSDITIEDKKIVGLSIMNNKKKTIVFTYGKTSQKKTATPKTAKAEPQKAQPAAAKNDSPAVEDDGGSKPITAQDMRQRLKDFCTAYEVNPSQVVAHEGLNENSTIKDYNKALQYAKGLAIAAGTY